MRVIDASSIVHAWDTYPPDQFIKLWDWLETVITNGDVCISKVALAEVSHASPDCHKWLKDCGVKTLNIDNAIAQEAIQIKSALGIVGDQYNPKGVDENDILIIATAKVQSVELISNEARQPNDPVVPSKRKIPAVCAMPSVGVSCISFLDFIQKSNVTF